MTWQIRAARVDEVDSLSELAYRSKQHWGYDADFMASCRGELSVELTAIAAERCQVLADGARIAGYYALGPPAEGRVEVDALFVEPASMGHGYGRLLMDHAKQRALELGCTHVEIASDPNALGFYLKMGARQVGERASESILNRWLPLLELVLI